MNMSWQNPQCRLTLSKVKLYLLIVHAEIIFNPKLELGHRQRL